MKRFASLSAIAVALPLLAFGPEAPRQAPNRWALIVGVSDYIHFQDVDGGDLPGAERDASAMRDVLVARWGFQPENVRMLLNQDATRAAIEQGLTGWLKQNVQPGDQVLLYFAGHGSQVWDENGDEEDGLDETIAPADVSPTSPENDITDDVLGEWLRALPTTSIVYIHDNCNAGTGTRSATPFSRARRLAREPGALPGGTTRRAIGQVEDQSGFDIASREVLELAAAQPDQAAVDAYFPGAEGTEPFHGGAFTTYLVQQLWRAPASASYDDVFVSVRESLKLNRFQQDPHISSEVPLKDAAMFAAEGSPTGGAFLPVVRVSGATAELGAGQAMGITIGSVLETDGGATLVVDGVTRDRATVRVTRGTVAAGAKARLVGYRHVPAALRVNVSGADTETSAALKRALGGTTRVTLIEQEQGYADLFLRRRGTEVRLYGLDGFPRKTFQSGAADAPAIARALMGEAAAKRLAELENPGQTFAVRLWLDEGKNGFGLGESIVIHASSERAGYLTVVDLGTDDKVTVLFPNAFHKDNKIAANGAFTFPSEAMGFEIQAQEPAGRGMVRAFVTPAPLDLPTDAEGFVTGDIPLADRVAESLRASAGGLPGAPDALRLDSWGTTGSRRSRGSWRSTSVRSRTASSASSRRSGSPTSPASSPRRAPTS